jgi:urease accessory protein
MLEIYERLGGEVGGGVDAHLVLDHEQRDKGRLRAVSTEGDEVRLFLDRGRPLQVGEILRSRCGKRVLVEGAVEPVVTATCDDWRLFSRACYHLGNRHVKLQVGERWLRIAPDHVLEALLQQLGLDLHHEQAVFIPESGAYHSGHHHH